MKAIDKIMNAVAKRDNKAIVALRVDDTPHLFYIDQVTDTIHVKHGNGDLTSVLNQNLIPLPSFFRMLVDTFLAINYQQVEAIHVYPNDPEELEMLQAMYRNQDPQQSDAWTDVIFIDKPQQTGFFDDTNEDLPLFSGTTL